MKTNQTFNILSAIKELDLVSWLETIGFQPAKVSGNNYWYLSPLRTEKTASFKVDRRLNKWYDHGLGQGGNLIDFAIRYYNCTVGEFIKLMAGSNTVRPVVSHLDRVPSPMQTEQKITILKEEAFRSYALCSYLQKRRISVKTASLYCREITFELREKQQYAIGLQNDSGGYELRNSYFKGSSTPKDITTISNGGYIVHVFEGFFDFLSFVEITGNSQDQHADYVILNSLSFFEKARPFMELHQQINLYLDRDTAGQNCSSYAVLLTGKYKDQSSLYQYHKDLNDWLVHFGSTKA